MDKIGTKAQRHKGTKFRASVLCAFVPRLLGFTLIEVMAATAILVIIVLIMSTVFHQSSVAWDAGTRKAEGNMMARATLGFMTREMEGAVAHTDKLAGNIGHNLSWVTFVTLGNTTGSLQRIVRKITYRLTSGGTIGRLEQTMTAGSGYGTWDLDAKEADLATNVNDLAFYTADGMNHTTNLPAWVRIEMGLNRKDDVSGVGVRSAGPNKVPGDGDDIKSW